MKSTYKFDEAGRLPLPGDNVAIAIRSLEAGTKIEYHGEILTLDYTVMEGHRFAVKTIAKGEALLSWELPFGQAARPIQPGQYVINQSVLEALSGRALKFALPPEPNFVDQVQPYVLDEKNFKPAEALPLYPDSRTFLGYRRSQARGVGTRNMIVLLGTTSRTGSYVKQLAARLQGELEHYPNVDGIVPVAHTEGGEKEPNNLELLLRTLAGFIVHPNVAAVLVADYGTESINNKMVEAYMREHHYPLEDTVHRFLSLSGSFQDQMRQGETIVRNWLPSASAVERTSESISQLKIGLQCGGSDAFSGISANPLLGWLAQKLIRYGGAANLAETDELIGAEPYVLQQVRNLETARKFISLVERFKTRSAWHGANAEGNPSGGNKYRGLYNIYLKSIGAARKKDSRTRLDDAIDYGERMKASGFYFMDSPGNDLESVAGQVASGCNLIFFTTGNGSITNFPFVPTIKVVTTSRRFELLSNDMDVNAGLYQEGMPMDELGEQTFDRFLHIASGQRSTGEKAGHAQVQIWRNWRQTDGSRLDTLHPTSEPAGRPIPIQTDAPVRSIRFKFKHFNGHSASDQVGLILPTSLCAGQVANMIVKKMNSERLGQPDNLSHFVTLTHTEGCGNSGGQAEELYTRTMLSYAAHPLVKHCLLLEHGCEKTHNDYMRHELEEQGVDPKNLGFASIQLDGGIESVSRKVEAWFKERLSADDSVAQETVGLEALRIAIINDGSFSSAAAEQLAMLTRTIVGAGGTVIVPENSGLLDAPAYYDHVLTNSHVQPSLAYGEYARHPGFHIMETPTEHWVETVTGLGATGVELTIALVNQRPMQTHPLVPMLQAASDPVMQQSYADDLDLLLIGDPASWTEQILQRCKMIMEHQYIPRLFHQGNIDFQLTRGHWGVSL